MSHISALQVSDMPCSDIMVVRNSSWNDMAAACRVPPGPRDACECDCDDGEYKDSLGTKDAPDELAGPLRPPRDETDDDAGCV